MGKFQRWIGFGLLATSFWGGDLLAVPPGAGMYAIRNDNGRTIAYATVQATPDRMRNTLVVADPDGTVLFSGTVWDNGAAIRWQVTAAGTDEVHSGTMSWNSERSAWNVDQTAPAPMRRYMVPSANPE